MSDLRHTAYLAERDLNSYQKKQGTGKQSVSATESGVNQQVEKDFPGSEVRYGGSGSRKIPPEEGGDIDARGRVTEAHHFEGPGGPEDKINRISEQRPGDDGVPVRRTNF
ncbi:hypothetical protein BGW36DRAFT_357040 [Talaromyces proteolyticus]|uniref:Uncharacterized protein n=1 Tax=Talaromyces proteolyticus TaxID=1131652 RepID=A0AAD4KT18_9EURO|nr:uncharacterized protein BGW36DRAFT_357040 [Talaromyces proteolyticus]KAH8700377.1 hypothetical protein BGW36DRAFT_357040 [Talaromyces proteolyticus]